MIPEDVIPPISASMESDREAARAAYERAPKQLFMLQQQETPAPRYTGVERRKSQRRVRSNALPIELRSMRDRRHSDSGASGHIDEKA